MSCWCLGGQAMSAACRGTSGAAPDRVQQDDQVKMKQCQPYGSVFTSHIKCMIHLNLGSVSLVWEEAT